MARGPTHKLVIVLDDDSGVLRAVQRLLTARGFVCEVFSSVQDFHIGARLHLAQCVILDINLDSESGIEVRRELTATWPSIPVIFITGNDNDGSRRAAMEAGCIAYLTKPFSADSLLDAIEKASARQPVRALGDPRRAPEVSTDPAGAGSVARVRR